MNISAFKTPTLILALAAIAGVSACQPAPSTNVANANTTETTITTNTSTLNTSTLNANVGTGLSADTAAGKEPNAYSANMAVRIQASGQQNVTAPPINVQIAKNGTDRRVSFSIPGGDVIYLDKADKRYLILPGRKQYAELTAASTGVDVQRLMTPGQILDQLRRQPGFEKVGEEVWNGRPAEKYRIAGVANTATQAAGQVSSESFIYVDKETGLPLHTETYAQGTGEKAKGTEAKVVTDLSNISTTVDPASFEIPQGYARIEDEKVRQQVDRAVQTALSLMSQYMVNANSNTGAAQPVATATPSPRP